MKDIKTRERNAGTVKTIDRASILMRRMRQASIKAKDQVKESISEDDSSEMSFAEENTMDMAGDSVSAAGRAAEYSGVKVKKLASSTINDKKLTKKAGFTNKNGKKTAENRETFVEEYSKSANKTYQYGKFEGRKPAESSRFFPEMVSGEGKSQPRVSFAKKPVKVTDFGKTGKTAPLPQATTVEKAEAAMKRQYQIRKAREGVRRRTEKTGKTILIAMRKAITSTKTLVSGLSVGASIALIAVIVCTFFGAAFYMFGDESSSNYIPVSQEVEAYTPVIQKYAREYGIPEYVELIKAVMMQESGGLGTDPMQCSESPYNTKYDHAPGSIKDPEYSINCGVHYLASCLKATECENPLDMEHIRLALQGYNYGNGYISWAKRRDGGYTVENAIVFSEEQAEKHGWESYGDKQYVAHVLRYYPYGSYNYGVGNTRITDVAAQQLGNEGGEKFWSWYGFSEHVEWCACYVSWCADQCGYIKEGIIPKFAGVGTGISWFQKRGQWQKRGYLPKPGDIIFFDWDGDGYGNHVGIVESCDGDVVVTLEGNSGNQCKRRTYNVNSLWIMGYGVPKY